MKTEQFKYVNDEQAREYFQSLVGKKIIAPVTAVDVEIEITEFEETQYAFVIRGTYRPVNWGGEWFTKYFNYIRKGDGLGGKYIRKIVE